MTPADPLLETRRGRRSSGRPRRRVTVLGVVGEILLTLGIVTLLYVAWQLWIGDVIYAAEKSAVAKSLSEQWAAAAATPSPTPDATTTSPAPRPASVEPVVLPQAGDGQVFANLYIPRFGSDYAVQIAGGVTRATTLDPIGVGHYPGTPMPGAVGNVGFAAHRTTYGKPFNRIADLHVGDAIVIETPDGWYTYRFRTLEYVTPDSIDVLSPVPQADGVDANGRYLTMTSCSPMYAMSERIVGYSVFESFTPRAAGAPASLTGGVTS
ncbi:class E sortase [Microbacterium sp. X-17]|uniref:class E sortase n=1 Tax=Microbacterium sp. X-17 TaxID=3144404 RepID=UPI0031F53E65